MNAVLGNAGIVLGVSASVAGIIALAMGLRPRGSRQALDAGWTCAVLVVIATLIRRTSRYAAYQRKWMRRIPGLVTVRADRPAGEVADEILEMARTRQRLPAGPAG